MAASMKRRSRGRGGGVMLEESSKLETRNKRQKETKEETGKRSNGVK
jgi:hypothetical protein